MSLRELVERGAKAYTAGDVEMLVGDYAPDAVLVTPLGRSEGIDAIRQYWAGEISELGNRSVELGVHVEAGDAYFGEFTVRGVNVGALQLPDGSEIPPTGKTVELVGSEYARMVDGRIVDHRMYWDNMVVFSQLGLLPG